MTNYLDFEKPLAEIEGKAEELRAMARQNEEMDIWGSPFCERSQRSREPFYGEADPDRPKLRTKLKRPT